MTPATHTAKKNRARARDAADDHHSGPDGQGEDLEQSPPVDDRRGRLGNGHGHHERAHAGTATKSPSRAMASAERAPLGMGALTLSAWMGWRRDSV